MSKKGESVKETVAEIAKQTMSTEWVLKDILANPDLIETKAPTVSAEAQIKMDQKLTVDCVQNAMKDLNPPKKSPKESRRP